MNKLALGFVKVTGLPVQAYYYHKKLYYEDNNKANKKIKGPALIISNHTSVLDYPLMMYIFFGRTLRFLTAELMYDKGFFLKRLLNQIGSIRVDRNSYDFSFIDEMSKCLQEGHLGLIFPEARIKEKGEIPEGELLPFKPSYVQIALENDVPIIPVFTNGMYGKERLKNHTRAKVLIGNPIRVTDLYDNSKSEKENIKLINDIIRNKIKELGNSLEALEHE